MREHRVWSKVSYNGFGGAAHALSVCRVSVALVTEKKSLPSDAEHGRLCPVSESSGAWLVAWCQSLQFDGLKLWCRLLCNMTWCLSHSLYGWMKYHTLVVISIFLQFGPCCIHTTKNLHLFSKEFKSFVNCTLCYYKYHHQSCFGGCAMGLMTRMCWVHAYVYTKEWIMDMVTQVQLQVYMCRTKEVFIFTVQHNYHAYFYCWNWSVLLPICMQRKVFCRVW